LNPVRDIITTPGGDTIRLNWPLYVNTGQPSATAPYYAMPAPHLPLAGRPLVPRGPAGQTGGPPNSVPWRLPPAPRPQQPGPAMSLWYRVNFGAVAGGGLGGGTTALLGGSPGEIVAGTGVGALYSAAPPIYSLPAAYVGGWHMITGGDWPPRRRTIPADEYNRWYYARIRAAGFNAPPPVPPGYWIPPGGLFPEPDPRPTMPGPLGYAGSGNGWRSPIWPSVDISPNIQPPPTWMVTPRFDPRAFNDPHAFNDPDAY
jgi:hypothetical protein